MSDIKKVNDSIDGQSKTAPSDVDRPAREDSNRFNLANLRLGQNFGAAAGVKKALLTIPVRKPSPQDFVRVHPDPAYRIETYVLELREERESYLVAPDLWQELPGELIPKVLFTAINRQGVVFLWPVRLPGEDGRIDEWNGSALEAADMAKSQWIRVKSNMSLGAYEVHYATGELSEPAWPEQSFQEILLIAFKGRRIESLGHPVIRRLQGML